MGSDAESLAARLRGLSWPRATPDVLARSFLVIAARRAGLPAPRRRRGRPLRRQLLCGSCEGRSHSTAS